MQVVVDRSLCCCSWWTFWTLSLNTDWAADIHHWNIWTVDEKLCLFMNIQCITAYSLEKVKRLNCCIGWTTPIASMKFTKYVLWILTYKVWTLTEMSMTVAKIQKFSIGLFLLAHYVWVHSFNRRPILCHTATPSKSFTHIWLCSKSSRHWYRPRTVTLWSWEGNRGYWQK